MTRSKQQEGMQKRGELVITCAWCGKEMGKKPGLGQSGVSHGICLECQQRCFPKTLSQDK